MYVRQIVNVLKMRNEKNELVEIDAFEIRRLRQCGCGHEAEEMLKKYYEELKQIKKEENNKILRQDRRKMEFMKKLKNLFG